MKSFHCLLLFLVFLVLLSGLVTAGTTSAANDQKKTILVDLSHAERVMVDGTVAPGLDMSQNTRILNWQDWADDMRSQGYDVRSLTDGPVTAEKLAGTCLVIIAEPDMGKNGVAYFTADEAKAIANYVESGHALLLMGHTFLGGPDKQSYRQDYTSNYMYALIQNALLKKMKVNMKFTADSALRPIGDIMIDPDNTDMVQGSMSDIWIHEGEKSHEVWKDIPDGRFAYFHGSSIDLPPKGGIAYGDAATFTTRDTTSVLFQDSFAAGLSGESAFMKRVEDVSTSAGIFGLVAKKQGDYPVAIAETRKGCGIIMLYGDSAAWQNSAYWGSVYTNSAFHEKTLAHNIVTYLTRHCEDCVTPTPTAAKAKTAPTKVILTPKAGVTVKSNGNCASCIDTCNNKYTSELDRKICYNDVCKIPGDIYHCIDKEKGLDLEYCSELTQDQMESKTLQRFSTCYDCDTGIWGESGSVGYSKCMKITGCTCPSISKPSPDGMTCSNCIVNCISSPRDYEDGSYLEEKGACIEKCGIETDRAGYFWEEHRSYGYCNSCEEKARSVLSAGSTDEKQLIRNYAQCLQENVCQCPQTTQSVNCNSCLNACKTGDTACVKRCEAEHGATGLCDCGTCQAKCGSDAYCLESCVDQDGKSVCDPGKGDCDTCIKGCSNATCMVDCVSHFVQFPDIECNCQSWFEACGSDMDCIDVSRNEEGTSCEPEYCSGIKGTTCPAGQNPAVENGKCTCVKTDPPESSPGPDRILDCAGCIGQCNGRTACSSQCKDSSGNSCLTASVIPPGTTNLVSSTGGCSSCITSCNEKTVDGVSLTDTELKQCYTACGSGLCQKTWTSCGGAGGFTVTGPAGIVGTNINTRAIETPGLGAILSTSANPRATVTPDPGVPSKFSKCTGYEDGQLGFYYCSDCNACTSYLAKGYQCSCEKNTEGLNPQAVTTADFTPGLRECYLSAMQGSSCSCPALSSDGGAILSTKYQRPTATVTPTPKGVVYIPDGKVLTLSGGDCASCITTCNEKTVDGVSLTDSELKQCYATCSSGFCQKTWTSCGGADTGTEGIGATLSTTANSRDTGNEETDGGNVTWTDSISGGCISMSDGKKTTWACPNCKSCKDHPNTQCSCPKNTEGSDPQTVTTADFTPGLRECYLSAMQGSLCSCPAPTPTPRPTARVFDIPQMTLVITRTPTATPLSRPTARVLPIPQQTIVLAKTPTPSSLTSKSPAVCTECRTTCKGMIGSRYSTCLGDCAEQKGEARSACIPQATLLLSTPQPVDLSSQWNEHSMGSPSNPSTGGSSSPAPCSGCPAHQYQCGSPGNCQCCWEAP